MIDNNLGVNIELRTLIDVLTPNDLENLLIEKREIMRRNQILSKYKIGQLPPPDNRYWVRIDGKQYFRKNKQDLENLIVKTKSKEELTLTNIFDEFIEQRKTEVASATWVMDKKYFDMYLKDSALGNKPIYKLTSEDCVEYFKYIKSVKGEVKEKYWHNVKSSLDMIIKYCRTKGYIDKNPFEYIKIHSSQFAPKTETEDSDTVFSAEEQEEVCRLAKLDAVSNENAIPLGIILLFNTGLRNGEMIASRWGDVVDICGQKHLFIRRIQVGSVDENGMIRGRETADRCKSKRSKRKVPLNQVALSVLEQIKQYNELNGFGTEDNDYIFQRIYKGDVCECTERCFAGRLKKYCEYSGMVSKSPHDIRRTALTNLWLNGVPIKVIQLIAGHNTQKQTEEYLKIDEKNILKNGYMELLCSQKSSKIG